MFNCCDTSVIGRLYNKTQKTYSDLIMFKVLFCSLALLCIAACGGGSSPGSNQEVTAPTPVPATYTGIFLDSAVEGLNYSTTSQSGKTNASGEFVFQADEQITFSIGSIALPTISSELLLTPFNIFDTSDINSVNVVNLLRLLQSLDVDGDPSNNIQISDDAHQFAQGLTIDFNDDNFEESVTELIAMSGSVNLQLISAQSAIDHFQLTLNQISNENITTCEKTHSMVGYTGFFETFHHNVAGKATIIDDCTIEITQFDYDGGGPEVYFYGAIDHNYDDPSAFAIGQKLSGQEYNNTEISIKLPQNKTLDDLTGLSVWCVDFNANFGQVTFTP